MQDAERLYDLPGKKESKKAVPVRMVQVIVCALLVLCVFGLYKSQSKAYGVLQARYRAITAEDLCKDGVWTAAKNLAQSVYAPVTEPETETPSAAIDERAEIETITSAGGEDIRVLDALKDASFAAVTVSQEAVMPVDGKVTSPFGYRVHPVTGKRSFHTGIDLAAPMGTPIVSAYAGTVAETGSTSGRGNYILVQHADNLQTLYCHLSSIEVQEGEVVEAGAQIGLVGSTGMSTGPHLHFELQVDGVRCNPVYVLDGLEYV